jgi:demethylsterigmatocystin 6-O-methyltransferase
MKSQNCLRVQQGSRLQDFCKLNSHYIISNSNWYRTEGILPSFLAMPAFFKQNGYRNTTDGKNCPFQLAHNTELSAYEYMATKPELATDFATTLANLRSGASDWLDVYPIQEETRYLDPQRVVFVDVGGATGSQIAALKERYPQLPGRFVLQDLPYMLGKATPIEGMEIQAHDFFTPQPVKGAKYCKFFLSRPLSIASR